MRLLLYAHIDVKVTQVWSLVGAIKGRWRHGDHVYGTLYRMLLIGKVLSEVSI